MKLSEPLELLDYLLVQFPAAEGHIPLSDSLKGMHREIQFLRGRLARLEIERGIINDILDDKYDGLSKDYETLLTDRVQASRGAYKAVLLRHEPWKLDLKELPEHS
jgi:hypothetical protein